MRSFLSDLAAAEIKKLEADGVVLTPADICRLNAHAHRVRSTALLMGLARGVPVQVGINGTLWPLTFYAADWNRRVGAHLGSQSMQLRALAYAMAHGSATMPEDRSEAITAIYRWMDGLKCTYDQLVEGTRQINAQGDADMEVDESKPPSRADQTTAAEISAMLAAMTHIPPVVWEYQCSIAYVLHMLDVIVRQNSAEGKSTKHDESVKAIRNLGMAAWNIKVRWQKEHGHGQ
jgi:hypothetical protein